MLPVSCRGNINFSSYYCEHATSYLCEFYVWRDRFHGSVFIHWKLSMFFIYIDKDVSIYRGINEFYGNEIDEIYR